MRIYNPQREAETVWVYANSINKVDIEAAVFQHESMEFLTGEYEAFLYDSEASGAAVLRISLQCFDTDRINKKHVEDQFIDRLLKNKPALADYYHDGNFPVIFKFIGPRGLELHKLKGRPKRLADRRTH